MAKTIYSEKTVRYEGQLDVLGKPIPDAEFARCQHQSLMGQCFLNADHSKIGKNNGHRIRWAGAPDEVVS